MTLLAPAQLWIGRSDTLAIRAHEFLQKTVCRYNNCSVCNDCRAVRAQQHHAILWVKPEKAYTQEDLVPVFNALSFMLDNEQHMFFVLHKADFLTATCANSLLKSLEEPPPGYHFILLAERPDQILPTIRSRCITHNFYQSDAPAIHATLVTFLCSTKAINPLAFSQELDTATPTEQESIGLVDTIFAHWLAVYKKTINEHDMRTQTIATGMIDICKRAITTPPMPGSSKLFWRTLFLQMHTVIQRS